MDSAAFPPAGDFDACYASAWPRLLRTASGVTQDEHREQDAVQTAFAQADAGWDPPSQIAVGTGLCGPAIAAIA